MGLHDKEFKEFMMNFDEVSSPKKFLDTVSTHLKNEYGVIPTSTGRRAIKAAFQVASDNRREKVSLGSVAIQQIVENWAKPVKTLH